MGTRPLWNPFAIVASSVLLALAVPTGLPRPDGPSEFPLAPMWEFLAATRARLTADPRVAGALEPYAAPASADRPEWTTKGELRGYVAGTSTRVADAATPATDTFINADGSVTRRPYGEPKKCARAEANPPSIFYVSVHTANPVPKARRSEATWSAGLSEPHGGRR